MTALPAMNALPGWMRRALFATAAMNLGAATLFLPVAEPLRALAGFPAVAHPLYPLTAGLFVLLFGIGYLWTAATGRDERLFIGLSAVGKLAFVVLVVGLWSAGSLPMRAAVLGSADLVFAILFFTWLVRG
jgi:hypothetical protein